VLIHACQGRWHNNCFYPLAAYRKKKSAISNDFGEPADGTLERKKLTPSIPFSIIPLGRADVNRNLRECGEEERLSPGSIANAHAYESTDSALADELSGRGQEGNGENEADSS
jgi:hypothetical protein